jgi:hypothetical protein
MPSWLTYSIQRSRGNWVARDMNIILFVFFVFIYPLSSACLQPTDILVGIWL